MTGVQTCALPISFPSHDRLPPTLIPTPPKFHSTQEATEDSWGSTTTSLFFGAVPTEQELRNEFGDIIKANKKSVVQPPRNNSINPNNLPYTQVQPGEVKPKFVEGTQYVTDLGVVDTSYISGARQVKYKNTDKKTKNKKKSEHNSTTTTSTTHYAFLNAPPIS